MLRDRFVVGLHDEATQRALLTEADLTFERAVEVASARKAAAMDVREMGRVSTIHALSDRPNYSKNNYKPSNSNFSNSNVLITHVVAVVRNTERKIAFSKRQSAIPVIGRDIFSPCVKFKNLTMENITKIFRNILPENLSTSTLM